MGQTSARALTQDTPVVEVSATTNPPDSPPDEVRPADRLFADKRPRIDDFDFGKKTAAVFDDMLNRSVPYYGETQRMMAEMAADFACDDSVIYDLGCSTANSILAIGHLLPRERRVRFVGLDSSQEMLNKARSKLDDARFPWPVDLRLANLNQGISVQDASVVLLILTLQFVRPLHRDNLLASIYNGLRPNGCLILVEKVLGENTTFNRLFIKYYYEYKRRMGYSEMEIAQKREALENVLIPYRLEEDKELLHRAGFQQVDIFFKWYNFCGIVARKTAE